MENTPRHCPIIVLGFIDEWIFVIDARGRFHALAPGDLQPRRLVALSEPSEEWLIASFPPLSGRQAFNSEAARAHLYSMAFERGLVDPQYYGFDVIRRGGRWVWGHGNGILR